MGKKVKLPFPFNSIKSGSTWPWPSCNQTRTLSFRASNNIYKTTNTIYLDTALDMVETTESSFIKLSEAESSTKISEDCGGDPLERMIRGLRSERLFFKPGETSSILEEAKEDCFPFKDSMVLSMESQEPHVDFRKSMEEMVEAHGVKDWEGFEELLCWYLRVNEKSNHGYIIGAFVDLLVGLAFASSSSSCSCSCSHSHSHSPSSPLSFNASSSSSSSTHGISSTEVEEDNDTACLSLSLQGQEGSKKR